MPRRVRRPADMGDVLKELTNGDNKLFDTLKDALVMAACLGFCYDHRLSFERTGEPVPWSVFKSPDVAIVDAIALAVTKDVSILKEENSDKRLTIFEEYAYGGLRLLKSKVLEEPGTALDNMLNLIFSEHTDADEVDDVPGTDILKYIAKSLTAR